jgi:hypothetical protein
MSDKNRRKALMSDQPPGVVLDLEPGKVREFARAIRADVDDPTGPDGSLIVPATFLTTMNFPEKAEAIADELGFDLSRMLHAEQEYEFHGPPPTAPSRLWVESRVVDRFVKRGRRGGLMRFAVRMTEFRDAAGTLVATARMTAVETQATPAGGAAS